VLLEAAAAGTLLARLGEVVKGLQKDSKMFRKRADVAQCQRSTNSVHFTSMPTRRSCFRGSEPVALGRRATALLRVLLERPGAPVSKDALIEAAWPGLAVEDSNLTVQIGALRRALAQEPGADDWIETLPRRGYRFKGPAIRSRTRPSKATSMQPTSRATTFRPR